MYVRPDAPKDGDDESAGAGGSAATAEGSGRNSVEQLRLRFHYSKTAFDTDLDAHPEKPWRKPRIDISDFFNYGFNETTWKVCGLFLALESYFFPVVCKIFRHLHHSLFVYSYIAKSSSSSAWIRGSARRWRKVPRNLLLVLRRTLVLLGRAHPRSDHE
jgi:hypothetical protein